MTNEEIISNVTNWIKSWFDKNAPNKCAIIGMSNGKDCAVTAQLCVNALGAERVIGVITPAQKDDKCVEEQIMCDKLGIQHIIFPIYPIINAARNVMKFELDSKITKQANIDLIITTRLSILHLYAKSFNGKVVSTLSLSKRLIGYNIPFGENIGDIAPLFNLTTTEIQGMTETLKLKSVMYKVSESGIEGQARKFSDEVGFYFYDIDNFIRSGYDECKSFANNLYSRIERKINSHDRTIPSFDPGLTIYNSINHG